MLKEKSKFNHRHIICAIVIIVSLLFSVFTFRFSFVRLYQSARAVYESFIIYIASLLDIEYLPKAYVLDIPAEYSLNTLFPINFSELWVCIRNYSIALIDKTNLTSYFFTFSKVLSYSNKFILIFLIIYIFIKVIRSRISEQKNNWYNYQTKPLQVYLKISDSVINPTLEYIKTVVVFFFEKHSVKPRKIKVKSNDKSVSYTVVSIFKRKIKIKPTTDFENEKFSTKEYKHIYPTLLLFIWLLNFNIITVALEFLAYFLYFSSVFDFWNIYIFLFKTFFDLLPMIKFIPIVFWICIIIVYYNKLRILTSLKKLKSLDDDNKEIRENLSICTYLVGYVRSGKTTTMIDLVLSTEIEFQQKALELMFRNDLRFPNFPWINLENYIKTGIENQTIRNWALIENELDKKFNIFLESLESDKKYSEIRKLIFDYDFAKYELEYYDELKVLSLFDCIKSYAKLYFLYIVKSSLIYSNLSIRVDNVLKDIDNFPLWNNDFFNTNKDRIQNSSRYSHILDFDALRLGKKIVEEDISKGTLEFGVIVVTEMSKERGNQLDTQEMKRNTEETNQKNDLFNLRLKLAGHTATVDGYPFVRFFFDDQRPTSLGADCRELCEIMHLDRMQESKILPLFLLDKLFFKSIIAKYNSGYYERRFRRADVTLFSYLHKNIISRIYKYYERISNKFSYKLLPVTLQNGSMETAKKEFTYHILPKKIYSNRFSTDCFREYFKKINLESLIGINESETYADVIASVQELLNQNSYWINDLLISDWRKKLKEYKEQNQTSII